MSHVIHQFPFNRLDLYASVKKGLMSLLSETPKPICSYIIGSKVKSIINQEFLSEGDIDIVVIVTDVFTKGCPIVNNCKCSKLMKDLGFGYAYNGVPIRKGDISIDLIPVMMSEVEALYPQVIFDLLNMDIVHFSGKNCLSNKMNILPTKNDLLDRIKITINYISRESLLYQDKNHWIGYIYKSILYTADLISINTSKSTSPDDWEKMFYGYFGSTPKIMWSLQSIDDGINQLVEIVKWLDDKLQTSSWPDLT